MIRCREGMGLRDILCRTMTYDDYLPLLDREKEMPPGIQKMLEAVGGKNGAFRDAQTGVFMHHKTSFLRSLRHMFFDGWL